MAGMANIAHGLRYGHIQVAKPLHSSCSAVEPPKAALTFMATVLYNILDPSQSFVPFWSFPPKTLPFVSEQTQPGRAVYHFK